MVIMIVKGLKLTFNVIKKVVIFKIKKMRTLEVLT